MQRLREWARRLKQDTLALYLVARHPQTPWLARLLIAGLVAYALSPIDLIPDFIPVVGYLDDLILLPLGIALVIRMIPPAVLDECRAAAQQAFKAGRPVSRTAGLIVVAVWFVTGIMLTTWAMQTLRVGPWQTQLLP